VYATAALNALERGEPCAAVCHLDEAAEVAGRTGSCATCSALLYPVAARAYLAIGDFDQAAYHADEARRVATSWESGSWRAMAAMAHAAVLQARTDYVLAYESCLAAAATFEGIGQQFDAARCLVQAGQACAAQGDAAGARSLVSRALSVFESLGAASAARQARAQLSR
jgi:tetratricopeptide (TPR) repeat protein